MNNNIEQLRTEVDDIKKSLNELKNNVNISESEKKSKAEAIKDKAEMTKGKIENEIKASGNKTDDESKKNKEEAEALLNSFNEITSLYESIIKGGTSVSSQQTSPEIENKNIFSKAKDWIGSQWSDVWDKEKWKTEGGTNLLRTAGFAVTGIGAISLAYKGIKNLFGGGKDEEEDDEDEETEKKSTKKKEDEEEKDKKEDKKETNDDGEEKEEGKEKSSSDKKHEEKESFRNKWYGKALQRLGIGTATGGGVYFLGKLLNWRGDKKDQTDNNNDSTQNEQVSQEDSTSKESNENKPPKKSNEEPKKVEETKGGIDKEKKTYTNSKSGLTFCMYDQNDPRRGSKKKNGGTTMNQTGCLLTSAAVIHSMIDPSITPDFYRQNYAGRYAYDSIPKASQHKIESKKLTIGPNTTKEIIDHLKKGYPVNFMVHGPKNGHNGKNPYTQGQHYRTAVDIRGEDGKEEIFIANTHNGKGSGWYPADKMFISLKEASLYTPTQA